MKKFLLMMLLLSCTVFVIGCNNNSQVDESEQMEMDASDSNSGEAPESIAARERADEGKYALETEKDYTKAVAAFTKSLEYNEAAWVYADRGRSKVLLGDKEGALADFSKAIELEQRDVYYEWRSGLYTEMGNTAAAEADMKEFEKLKKAAEAEAAEEAEAK
ncbi:MAG: hypothetical protein PHT81_02875 [Endomicrobiaceae bacterium]|nr:hypothetical protein [Endomicrobiaceae bacterium]